MFLSFTIALNLSLVTVILARCFAPCDVIAWSPLLTLFSVSLLLSIGVHMYRWKCWKYLRHRPTRLKSFHMTEPDVKRSDVCLMFLWLEAPVFVALVRVCGWFPWYWGLFAVLPACIYTASCAFTRSSSESFGSDDSDSESSLSSSVNGEDLASGKSSVSSLDAVS